MTRRQAGDLHLGVRKAQQGPGVALGDLLVADARLDLLGQFEQPEQVRERRAVQAEPAGQLLLGPAVARQVLAERGAFSRALRSSRWRFSTIASSLTRWSSSSSTRAGISCSWASMAGAEPALAGDQLEPLADRPDEDRLEHAVLAERVGQRGDLVGVELPAGLERVRVDLVDGQVDQLGGLQRAGLEAALLGAEQRGRGRVRVVVLIHGR